MAPGQGAHIFIEQGAARGGGHTTANNQIIRPKMSGVQEGRKTLAGL